MRAIMFTTCTPNNQCFVRAFTCLGIETRVVQYDVPNMNIAEVAAADRPDVMIYIGAPPHCHINRFVPDTQTLKRANSIAPMVHLCSDSGDQPWWPWLEEYHHEGAFALQVSMDGAKDSPMARVGRVALTPVDPSWFPKVAWKDRRNQCSFSGNLGFRGDMVHFLRVKGVLTYLEGSPNKLYQEMADLYAHSKSVVNNGMTGSGQRWHVKGRVVEAGLAGAALIESSEAPTKDWFEPGTDYLTWTWPNYGQILNQLSKPDQELEEMAKRFHERMMVEHSPQAFYGRVFDDIGLKKPWLGEGPN